MTDKFDKVAKGLAQSITRRQALRRCGVEAGAIVLGTGGLARRVVAAASGPSVIIVQNFTGFTNAACPKGLSCDKPDCSGAVGPVHFVELGNNHYGVYRKSDRLEVQSASMDD